MKVAASALALLTLGLLPVGFAGEVTPISKVLQLLSDLQAKIISEGESAHKVFSEFAEWCEDRSKDLHFEIETGRSEVASLKATIEEEVALTGALNAKVRSSLVKSPRMRQTSKPQARSV